VGAARPYVCADADANADADCGIAQIAGRKHFVLASPDGGRLYPFSRLHPGTRQSQVSQNGNGCPAIEAPCPPFPSHGASLRRHAWSRLTSDDDGDARWCEDDDDAAGAARPLLAWHREEQPSGASLHRLCSACVDKLIDFDNHST
jgi:hypothetical protein